MPGMGELLIILVIVLLIFGAGKLPAIGDAVGRSIKNFKRAAGGGDEIEVSKTDRQLESGSRSELSEGRQVDDAELVGTKKAKVEQ